MFDSLEERIKHDEAEEVSPRERVAKGLLIAVLSILLFGGLYFALRMIEGWSIFPTNAHWRLVTRACSLAASGLM